MTNLIVHDPAGVDHFRSALGAEVSRMHGNTLSDGSYICVCEPSENFMGTVSGMSAITVFPPAWKPSPLSPEHVAVLSYAGVQVGHTMYDALQLLRSFHGNPFYAPEMF